MASCRNCKLNVGCGCQLINGLCGTCNDLLKKGIIKFKNAFTKTH